jgi:HlyD family secretion protein
LAELGEHKMKFKKTYVILSIPVIIAFIAVIFLITKSSKPNEIIITGVVESKQVDVASKIPGRIEELYVDEGSVVKQGDVLAKLESKELDAKVGQAQGAMEAAQAKFTMAKNGARKEEKRGAEQLYIQAKSQFEYAEKTWKRFQALYSDKVISTQENDEMEFKYNAAKAQMEAAKSKYDMAMNGARPEEIKGAEGLFHQAENAYNEAMAYYSELQIKAPVDGEVTQLFADKGEVINSGYPAFSILPKGQDYVVIQLREDLMKEIKLGKVFKGKISALGIEATDFVVDYIAPMADFATWKPTNQKGEFDLKTFEIHLKPKSKIDGFRPGMTVNIIL